MAQIEVTPDQVIIRLEGSDKLMALKSELAVPLAHISGAEPAEAEAREWWHGIRLGAVHVPGVISVGTFHHHGQRLFWDVHDPERAIAIAVQDDRYSRIVVEVDDPANAVAAIESAISVKEVS